MTGGSGPVACYPARVRGSLTYQVNGEAQVTEAFDITMNRNGWQEEQWRASGNDMNGRTHLVAPPNIEVHIASVEVGDGNLHDLIVTKRLLLEADWTAARLRREIEELQESERETSRRLHSTIRDLATAQERADAAETQLEALRAAVRLGVSAPAQEVDRQ